YLGDGLLVYFGYPRAHEDDAQRAVRAGLAMVEALGQLNVRLAQEGLRPAPTQSRQRGCTWSYAWAFTPGSWWWGTWEVELARNSWPLARLPTSPPACKALRHPIPW